MQYNIHEHRHRFAAWCAATAARASRRKCTFTVKMGKSLIEDCGLSTCVDSWSKLPEALDFDEWHKKMRCCLIHKADLNSILGFSHGVAAKLINVI